MAVDSAASNQILESYPYAQGVEELLEANPQAHIVELDKFQGSRAIGLALNAVRHEANLKPCSLREDCGAARAPGCVTIEVLPDADREIEKAGDLVVSAIKNGLTPEDIYVASPNNIWASRLARALGQRGIASCAACQWTDLAKSDADFSNDARYLKILTAILLAGDPRDDNAWRSWCAFNEPLAGSGEIASISRIAAESGMRLHEALASNELRMLSERLATTYQMGVSLLGRINGMPRDRMLRTLTDEFCGVGNPIPPILLRLCSGTNSSDDATTLRSCILEKMACKLGWESTNPDAIEEKATVHIGEMNRMCGLSPRLVVIAGFVNGFFPKHSFFDKTITPPGELENVRASYLRTLCCALGKATDSVSFTCFTKIPCSEAEQLGLKIDRIGLENRIRIARVSPSIFSDYLSDGIAE